MANYGPAYGTLATNLAKVQNEIIVRIIDN